MPPDILDRPDLVAGIEQAIRARLDHHRHHPIMAFGLVQVGLAAARIRHADLTDEIIDLLAARYWSTGMGSFHNGGALFNTDISGGFPYLCASALVYADPGHLVLFPACPPHWRSGTISGLRLRGAIILQSLSWTPDRAEATLVADQDQVVRVETPGRCFQTLALVAGQPQTLTCAGPGSS